MLATRYMMAVEEQWLPGRHFAPLLEDNQWRIVPFVLIWVLFALLLLVSLIKFSLIDSLTVQDLDIR